MWQIKTFKTRQAMDVWLIRRNGRIQWQEVFINNGFAVEYRHLHRIG